MTFAFKVRGFSLVEMAVVLVVVGILMASLMGPITAQLEYQRSREAKRLIADSKEAILGFMLRNKRLPCPANASLAEGATNAGKEDCSLATTAYGVLPWVDLGLPQLDPWGRRYRYAVTSTFSDATAGVASTGTCTSSVPTTGASFSWCMAGDKDIKGAGGTAPVADKVVVVVLSHGKNGLGGYGSDGGQLAGAVGDELENADGDNIFISTTITDSPVFDDLVDWIAPPIIFNRMVAAGLLP